MCSLLFPDSHGPRPGRSRGSPNFDELNRIIGHLGIRPRAQLYTNFALDKPFLFDKYFILDKSFTNVKVHVSAFGHIVACNQGPQCRIGLVQRAAGVTWGKVGCRPTPLE